MLSNSDKSTIAFKFSSILCKYKTKSRDNQMYALCPEKDRTVAVTKESETFRQRIIINWLPVSTYKSRNEQKKGALRLMEISYQNIHNLETVSGYNDYAGADLKLLKTIILKISDDGSDSIFKGIIIRSGIRCPLIDIRRTSCFNTTDTDIIQ